MTTAPRKTRPSGVNGAAQKRARGQRRIDAWVGDDVAARLEDLADRWGVSKREALTRLILTAR